MWMRGALSGKTGEGGRGSVHSSQQHSAPDGGALPWHYRLLSALQSALFSAPASEMCSPRSP